MPKKTVIGITGRTGSGKSYASRWIKESREDVALIDCDKVGHDVLEDPTIKKQLITTFGNTIQKDNKINRSELRNIVFNDKEKLAELNDIVHPIICDRINDMIEQSSNQLIIIEGALIHHVGLEHACTLTICIDSPTQKILERQPEKDIILSKQPKANDYINMCTHTIKNNASTDRFEKKIDQLLTRLNID